MANWRIGMKAVCVKNSADGVVKAGEVYVVSDISTCHTTFLHLDGVGRVAPNYCVKCRCDINHGWKFGDQRFFIPLSSLESDLGRIEEKEKELVLIEHT